MLPMAPLMLPPAEASLYCDYSPIQRFLLKMADGPDSSARAHAATQLCPHAADVGGGGGGVGAKLLIM